jgi:SEC-C motif domain protein
MTITIPCDDAEALKNYCAPFLSGQKKPETAAELMASRYVAYTVSDIDYLMNTLVQRNRSQADRKSAEVWSKSATWLGLEIVSTEAGGANDQTGVVEFKARFKVGGQETVHHERAEFERVNGQWLFADGKLVGENGAPRVPFRHETPKQGRNDQCACGSGLKFKKCHGK